MADIDWPAGLPQRPSWTNYQETPPNLVVRTQMDSGPPKVRRRFTAGVRPFKCGFDVLTATEIATLDDFFLNTTGGGALRFNWIHPRTGVAAELRFVSAPAYTAIGGLSYSVTMDMEILP